MTWFRVDDSFSDHPKVVFLLEKRGGLRAIGLWTLAGSWTAKQERDGYVPSMMIRRLGATLSEAEALVAVGLWETVEGGYLFQGWEERNPLKTTLEDRRNGTKERVRAHRERERNALQAALPKKCNALPKRDDTHSLPRPFPDPSQTLPGEDQNAGAGGDSPDETKTEPPATAPDSRFAEMKTAIRKEFAVRFERAEGSLWTQAGDPGVDLFVAWALSMPEPMPAAQRAMGTFFADPYCRERHYPVAHLAKYPQRYHEPRQGPEGGRDAPETVQSLLTAAKAAVLRGDFDAADKFTARRLELEKTADERSRRVR